MGYLKFPIVLAVFGMLACANPQPANKATSASMQITLPDSLEWYPVPADSTGWRRVQELADYKLFTVINVSCASCIQKLDALNQLLGQTTNCSTLAVVPVCTSSDRFELLKFLVEEHKVSGLAFPLLLDQGRQFGKLNNSFADDMSGVAVLTDRNNNILLTGKPLEQSADRDRFLQIICNLKD